MIFLICGFGRIGQQRARAILDSGSAKEIYIYDPFLSKIPGEFKDLMLIEKISSLKKRKLTHVLISTPHDQVLSTIEEIIHHKPRILIEKPMGRNLHESNTIYNVSKKCKVSVGFNYRFMPGIQKLKRMISLNELGPLNSIRFDLGHGGSPGDEKTWKLNKESAGGGSLLDPGIHLIDLILHLFEEKSGGISIDGVNYWSGFWNTGVEESSMVLGRVNQIPFSLISSIVAWKTRFFIEVIGNDGYIKISGRGRSDGPQSFTIGRRWGWLDGVSQSETEITTDIMSKDHSIIDETRAWLDESPLICSAEQALESMFFYQKILDRKSPF